MNIVMETSATDSKQQTAKADNRSKTHAHAAEFGDTLNDLVQRDRADRAAETRMERAHAIKGGDSSGEKVGEATRVLSEADSQAGRSRDATESDQETSDAESFPNVAQEVLDSEIANLSQEEQLTLSMVRDGYKLSGAGTGNQLSSDVVGHSSNLSNVYATSNLAQSNAMASGAARVGDPLAPTLLETSAATFNRLNQGLTGTNIGTSIGTSIDTWDRQQLIGLSNVAPQTQASVESSQLERHPFLATSVLGSVSGNTESPLGRSSGAFPTIEVSTREPQTFATSMATHLRVIKNQGGGEAKVNLHPAELGRMSVSVITEGNETKVAFTVETSQARQAVEASLSRLREMLEQAGLSLADSNVSEQNRQSWANDEPVPGQNRGRGMLKADDLSEENLSLSVHIDPDRLLDTYV
jgi:flagellar hook-length control protein FliK